MAQKNLLPMILLGLIEQSPKTGYDLKKAFETEVGEFWSAKHSQVYVELKKMETDGEISAKTGFFGNNIEKTYYTITDKGKEKLESWLDSFDDELLVTKDEFVLKLYFIHDKNDSHIGEMLRHQLIKRQMRLAHLEERMKLLFPDDQTISDNYGHYLILDHAIGREKECVDWLKKYSQI